MSFNLYKSLNEYKTDDPDEQDALKKIIHFLNSDDNCFSRTNLKGHITAGALVIDNNCNILLNHHKKLNKWLHFGGHSDGDPNSLNVAKREVAEECGLTDFDDLQGKIFDVDVHLIPENISKNEPAHYHYDIRFLFITNNKEFHISNESINIKWADIEESQMLITNPATLRMIKKAYLFHTQDL